ncbi:Na+/H+ antiporter NhaA [Pelotalea chapellei]|uniref:Na+/H+ antiporter NhaA n=1 Tax=Pelotalea chapellei TaxID=44671 RepID=A0ABS5U3S2_9BACT|nr:Na+/H+ antiporter NhaA [Pelotalea chapellei]MBT1070316.1 Na+/H+ antiporter NhaA [Pelotalea chapellei]
MAKPINLLREFSIPLISGIVVALIWSNFVPESYYHFDHDPLIGPLSFHFLTNDIFMVLFFGIAAAEITQSCLPGGELHPLRKAVNPLFATIGGVVGPVMVYFGLNALIGNPALNRGWGIPTATDIALAWLVARIVFGDRHPAISFLLLLAIADDAIGLAIIAIFYPDPSQPAQPVWLLATLLGMAVTYGFRRFNVKSYWPYLLVGGTLSWVGLFNAHLHPALALVFIVPFFPHANKENLHIFEEDSRDRSTMHQFEEDWKVVVDFGLFMFGLANAGVRFSSIGQATWLVLWALVIGKTCGIFLMGRLSVRLGYPLPKRVGNKELALVGLIAGIGLTVALFVAGEAFTEQVTQGAAKMGALLSAGCAFIAIIAGRLLKVKRIK